MSEIIDVDAVRAKLNALREEVGPKSYVNFSVVADERGESYLSLYVRGIAQGCDIFEYGTSFEECLEKVTARWREIEANYRADAIKRMALTIIRLTAELGECSDAALLAEFDFDATEVSNYGREACELANSMAANGPFKIVATDGDNTGEN